MKGWKTWTAALGLMLAGAGKALQALTAEIPEPGALMEGVQLVLSGLALVGLGHKLEKR